MILLVQRKRLDPEQYATPRRSLLPVLAANIVSYHSSAADSRSLSTPRRAEFNLGVLQLQLLILEPLQFASDQVAVWEALAWAHLSLNTGPKTDSSSLNYICQRPQPKSTGDHL